MRFNVADKDAERVGQVKVPDGKLVPIAKLFSKRLLSDRTRHRTLPLTVRLWNEDMMNGYRPLAVAICCLTLTACGDSAPGADIPRDPHDVQASAPGQAGCQATSSAENSAGAKVTNAARSRAGLPPVRANMLLARVAAEHACDMATRGMMSHRGSTSTGPGPRVKAQGYAPTLTAENIAAGPFDLSRVLWEWNASRSHLDNIMIPQVRDYGIGQAVGSDGKTRFWSAIYAAPR